MGGTSLTLSGGNYGSETGWSGSGGGISGVESQPSYQQGLVIHNGSSTVNATGMRANPDVAFDANPSTGVAVYDSYDGGSSPWYQYWRHQPRHPLLGRSDRTCRPDAGLGRTGDLEWPDANLARALFLARCRLSRHYFGHEHGQPELHGGYTPTTGSSYNLVTGLGTPVANLLVPGLAMGIHSPT